MIPTKFQYRGSEVELQCVHAKDFPSPLVFQSLGSEALQAGESPIKHVELRYQQGEFKTVDQMNLYGKFQVWRRECGILQMGEKCLGCRHARLECPKPGNSAQTILVPWQEGKHNLR